MILNSPYISGSLTVTSNGTISGSLTVLGGITGAITGSATSASYAISASEASTLQGLGSASFAPASTFNTVSQSYAAASASLSTRVTTNETNISTLTSASASFAVVSSSYAAASGSLSTRVTNVETTASVLTSASSSFATMSGSLSTRVTNLEATSSTVSQSFASTSGSISGRVTLIEGQYATTGSNNFTRPQQISDVSNAISFTSTASLYTAGGLRVSKDSFVSGTAYFNNVVVYGTSSIQYLTSSQVNVGANIINLNTQTPAVRYGGMAVADSGSNAGVTGSLLWDSEQNRWIYSNPSGSTYDGGMLISGPRNTTGLGNEVGTTSCALMMGQGGDHITSSAIFHYSNATCIPNTLIGSTICSTMLNASCIGIGTTTPGTALDVVGFSKFTGIGINASPTSLGTNPNYIRLTNTGGDLYVGQEGSTGGAFFIGSCAYDSVLYGGRPLNVIIGGNSKMYITAAGVTTFACQVCAPTFILANGNCITALRNTGGAAIGVLGFTSGTDTLFVKGGNSGGAASIQFQDTAGTMATFYNSSLGIGITTPCKSLHVVSTSEQLRLAYDSTNTVYSDFRNDSAGGLLINTSNSYIINYIGGTERLRILDNCSVIIRGSFGICNGGAINMTIPNGLNGGSIRMACCTGANEGDMYLTGGGAIGVLIAGSGRVGIGTTTPCAALDVNCNFGSIISATTRTNDACCSEVRAGWVGGSYMRMGYHPSSAVGYIDNTYNIVSGQVFGDVQFRQNAGGTMVTRLLLKADGGLILACGRTSSIMASNGNIQEWVGSIGAVSNNTGWSLFSITNQYDILSMDIYVFTDVGSYQASKHDVVFGYTQFANNAIGFGSAFCIFKTGTLYNETMTICNLSGANVNNQRIAIRVWGYAVGQNGTGGTNLLTTSCLTRIK